MFRKIQLIILSLFVYLLTASTPLYAQNAMELTVETAKQYGGKWTLPSVSAHSAVLIDADTGQVLYERDGKKQRPPASTTKIMTAILAIELAGLDEVSTVSERAGGVGESTIYLDKGDKIKISELLEGALLSSGNDACVALAEQTAGSLDEFICLMNQKAVSIGAYQTHFENPNGLPDPEHLSTAYDLALMARYAMNNPVFSDIVGMKYATIQFEYPPKSQQAKNTNKLLWNYVYADGVKTGTTNAAGKCLVASASRDDRRLICAVLNAPDRFGDAARLLEWGFQTTTTLVIGKKGASAAYCELADRRIPMVFSEDVRICLNKDQLVDLKSYAEPNQDRVLPIKAGDRLGYYIVSIGDQQLIKTPLVAAEDVNLPNGLTDRFNIIVNDLLDFFAKKG